jgi:hypothetical protein
MTEYEHPDPKCPDCPDLPVTKCPSPPEPTVCQPTCKCPPGPTKTKDCLEELIEQQIGPITKGDKAKAFKAELEALLGKANAGSQDYTRDKYDKLLKQWSEEDAQIVDLIYKLKCALPCWRCIIDCHICPLLHELTLAEERLLGDGGVHTKVFNLYDQLYWQNRDKAAKERRFNRIKNVLAAWEKPGPTIEKALADNAKLIADICKSLCTEPAKAVYDVFFKLVPLHLAIAPPPSVKKSKIDPTDLQFCWCDKGCGDVCCGVDVGEPRMALRLIGPQPFLIEPKDYFKLICCLVECRYLKAKEQLSDAEGAVATTEALIKRSQAVLDNGLKTFEKDAKAAIPSVIDCDGEFYKPLETSHA